MLSSRRRFLKAVATSSSLAAIPAAGRSVLEHFAEDSLQARLAADPLRPQFHLLPAKNWMNDPNGPIYWNGFYHMFFQYNPNAAVWGDMHWNHAVSEDMIHWRHMPIALAPTPGWADADGCFTGSAVNDNGTATILYTGVQEVPFEQATLRDGHHNFRETQCLATSTDPKLLTWNKWKDPVLQPPNDEKLTGFRDPFLWQDEKTKLWYLGVASGQFKVGGRVLLYRSKDLRSWEYLHPLATGKWREKENTNSVDSGEMWECPDFFPLGKKHVLLYSTAGQVIWEVGELDPHELIFHPQKRGVLDHGAYYAQKTQLDAKGNRILWGWIPERRPDSELIDAGWAGCMALPRVLSLSSDDALEMKFAPQIDALASQTFNQGLLKDKVPDPSIWVKNRLTHFRIENLSGQISMRIREAPLSFELSDLSGSWLSVSLSAPSNGVARLSINQTAAEVPFGVGDARSSLRLYLDGSVAELILADRYAFTVRQYRAPNGSLRLAVKDSDLLHFETLRGYQMRAVSHNRLTT